MMAVPMLLTFGCGIILRVWLATPGLSQWLADRVEISTPLTSWKRVTEGLALHKAGVSPYAGDIFHEMPLMLRFLNFLSERFGDHLYIAFLLCDVLTAILLERIAKHFSRYMLMKQAINVKEYSPDAKDLILRMEHLYPLRFYVVAAYMINPYSIACCLAKSTAVFNNLAIVLTILFTIKGSRALACFFIAVSTYISMYPIMFVVPTALYLAQLQKKRKTREAPIFAPLVAVILTTVAFLAGLLYISYLLTGSWAFLRGTFGFILTVPDLTPNIGIFWYFFTEMFDHFRTFFIMVFQINVFIYTVPLAIRLRDHPLFLMYMLVGLMAIFKSYPSYGDVALYLALLPLWSHAVSYMRNTFVVTCMYVICTVLGPILYHLWIYAGSANANFYFAITLVYSTAQIFLVTDLLFGFLRREYDLLQGPKPPVINDQPAQVILE